MKLSIIMINFVMSSSLQFIPEEIKKEWYAVAWYPTLFKYGFLTFCPWFPLITLSTIWLLLLDFSD